MRCSDDDLAALVEGALDPAQAERVLAHVDACATCRLALGSAAERRPPLIEGARVGRYVLERQLGAGASGQVWIAHDPELDRRVALKVLHDDLEAADERVRREGRAVARLRHPGVVGVHEVGVDDGRAFLVMELVDGQPLDAWCRAQAPDAAQKRALAQRVTHALAAIHGAGLVHGDLKPANVLVTADGEPRLVDLGLARGVATAGARDEAGTRPAPPPRAGGAPGTPAYMAPELLAGGAATAASDQFALCVSLLEAFTGRRPFGEAQTVDALRAAQARQPAPPPELPPELGRALTRGLAVDPAARHADVLALAVALEPGRARPGPLAIALVALVVLVVGAAAFAALRTPARPLPLPRAAAVAPVTLASVASPDADDRAAAAALALRLAHADEALYAARTQLETIGGNDATRACVHLRERELTRLARRLVDAPLPPALALGHVVRMLAPVDNCWRLSVGRTTTAFDLPAALVAAEALAELRVAAQAPRADLATRAQAVHAQARAAGAEALAASASELEAIGTWRMADARPIFQRALLEAERAGDSATRAQILLSWCNADMQRGSFAELSARLDHAQAVIDELDAPEALTELGLALRCALERVHGVVSARASCQASLDHALAAFPDAVMLVAQRQFELALALAPAEAQPLLERVAPVLDRWGSPELRLDLAVRRARVAGLLGDAATRRRLLEAAGALIAREGATVLTMLTINLELAADDLHDGAPERALARLAWLVPLAEVTLGDDVAVNYNLRFVRGQARFALGDHPGGIADLRAGYEGLSRLVGQASHGADDYGVALVWALLDDGQLTAAREIAESLWRRASLGPAGSLPRLEAQGVLAMTRGLTGDHAGALEPARAYVAGSRALGDPPSVRVEVSLILATSEWHTAPARRAAIAAEVAALRAELVAEGPAAQGAVAQVDAWRRAHR